VERVFHDHVIEAGGVCSSQSGRVGVPAEAENRDVGIRVRDVFRLDATDVGDDQVRLVDAVGGDEMVPRQQGFQLPPEKCVDPTEQDRGHAGSVAPLTAPVQGSLLVSAPMADGEFVPVARVADVPAGTVRTVHAGDEEIALAHCDGGFYAVQQQCLHLQGPLGEGSLYGCVLSCPWHGWQYDVRTGKNEFDLAIQLKTYDVKVEDGEISVRI
jgi:nitrite reductase (NADH) small subunit